MGEGEGEVEDKNLVFLLDWDPQPLLIQTFPEVAEEKATVTATVTIEDEDIQVVGTIKIMEPQKGAQTLF